MPTLEEKLKNLLEANLADGLADLETLPDKQVCGHVVSSEFRGKDYGTRRQRIREVFEVARDDGRLTAEEFLHISTLLTYTPEEWDVVTTQ
jgi:acid stress-induced BolA-like protein IbaG/YrbA